MALIMIAKKHTSIEGQAAAEKVAADLNKAVSRTVERRRHRAH
jgi:hypothetical protein